MAELNGHSGDLYIGGELIDGEIVGGTKVGKINNWRLNSAPTEATLEMRLLFENDADTCAADNAINSEKDFTLSYIDGHLSMNIKD